MHTVPIVSVIKGGKDGVVRGAVVDGCIPVQVSGGLLVVATAPLRVSNADIFGIGHNT